MKRGLTTLVTGLGVLGLAGQLVAMAAAQLTLQPTPQTIHIGQPASVDVMIAGLGDGTAPSLGAFDLFFSYDESVILAEAFEFGTGLDLGNFGSLQLSDLTTPGLLAIEVSLEDAQDLIDQQPDAFRLGTIKFNGVAAGTSAVSLDTGTLSDEVAQKIPYEFAGASITVTQGIPDAGSTLTMLTPVLLGLGLVRRARR